jgi:hypothetical protein
MESTQSAYKIWAPDGPWTPWAKPVLFAARPHGLKPDESGKLGIPDGVRLPADKHTAVIVDLPGQRGVLESLALARDGFRPVPLYNGVVGDDGLPMTVDVRGLISALVRGAQTLQALSIAPDAPPVFMLDADRMNGSGAKNRGMYDNRWSVFPQDMPSAAYLLDRGIEKIVLCARSVQADLSHILYAYQKRGLDIYLYNDTTRLRKQTVTLPSWFKRSAYRFKVILGLKRNAAGGFGGAVPDVNLLGGAAGGGHYGYG